MRESDEEILAALAEIAGSALGWHGPLARHLRLVEGLGLDSLRRLTLVVAVEDRFHVCLDERDEAAIETVGDLVDAIRRKRAQSAAHAR